MGKAAPARALPLLIAALALPGTARTQDAGALADQLLRAPRTGRSELLGRPEFTSVAVARALVDLGEKARIDADYPRGVEAFQAAEVVARRAGAEREAGQALSGLAHVLYLQGQLSRALEVAGESLGVRERLGDGAELADAWNIVGHIRNALAEFPAALGAYRRALDLWTAAGDRRNAGRAVNNIGLIHIGRGEFDEALLHYQQALRMFEEVGEHRFAAITTNNIGYAHFHRGEYPEALEYCTRSRAMLEAIGDPMRLAGSLGCLANVHRARGSYAHALDLFHQSLKLGEEIGHKWHVLETWHNIGLVYFAQGDYRLAIDAYKRGLRMNREMGGTSSVPEGLMEIAAAAWRLGDRRRAEANHAESLRLSQREGNEELVAANLQALGRMALETGRHADADVLLKRALEAREALKSRAGTAEALNALATLRLATGRPREALDLAGRSAEIARTFEQPEVLWESQTVAGVAQRRLGQADAARRSFQQAIEVIEGLRLQVVGRAQGRERFFESKLSPYHERIALAMAEGSDLEALELAERSKARALADLLQSGRVDVTGVMAEADRREEAHRRSALASLNRRIQAERVKDAPDAGRLASLEAERQARRSSYEGFQASLYAKHPDLRLQRGGAAPFQLAEAGPLVADASVALLEYAVTEDASFLFVVTRAGGEPRLDSFRLDSGRAPLSEQARQLRERLAGRDLAYAESARRLHDLLLAPAGRVLEGKTHLVVVPDGPLWDVPFQALQDAAGRYVLDSAAVSYAPSLTVLREMLRKPARNKTRPRTILAMGKANFGGMGDAPALPLMSGLAALPDAERQVRLIAALYGPERSAVHLGGEASEDRFKVEAPRHDILHLATHGVLEETSPLYSHVVLSPGRGGSSEDGLLEAWEVLDLKLSADVVVLSACETGRGRIAPGEGIVGTTWAFFVAGSRALVVAQWKVEAVSTRELMTAFHRRLAQEGGGTAAHLREASLEVRRQVRYAHPFYWAGFVLVGDPY